MSGWYVFAKTDPTTYSCPDSRDLYFLALIFSQRSKNELNPTFGEIKSNVAPIGSWLNLSMIFPFGLVGY